MKTEDGLPPRLELIHKHDDGDIAIVVEVTFRGDVRKILGETAEELSKDDAEGAVAANLFRGIQAFTLQASSGSDETEDGAATPED